MGPFITFWSAIKRVAKFLDDHDGGITAVATVLIVVLTCLYVHYAERQWSAMEGQLEEMTQQLEVQKSIARKEHGTPRVNLLSWADPNAPMEQQQGRWFALYSVAEGKKPTAIVKVKNDGKGEAEQVSIAIDVELLETPPKKGPNGYSFSNDRFKPVGTLTTFDQKRVSYGTPQPSDIVGTITGSRSKPISPEEHRAYQDGRTALFVWGHIQYKDFLSGNTYITGDFCYWFESKDVPDSGTSAQFPDCEQFVRKQKA